MKRSITVRLEDLAEAVDKVRQDIEAAGLTKIIWRFRPVDEFAPDCGVTVTGTA